MTETACGENKSGENNVSQTIAQMDESIALPRKNGELVFEEPWEARAFGLAVALNEEGVYPWQEFSSGLAQTITAAEKELVDPTSADPNSGDSNPGNSNPGEALNDSAEYYQRWLASLEELILHQGLVTHEELEAEIAEQIHHDAHDHHH